MKPELYRRASELFNQLRELPAASVPAALDRECDTNSELRAQVIRMLAADRRANGDSFLERRAVEDAAQLLQREAASLPHPGTLIGNYKLGERIGAGGMGVVYEAEDLRLHRRVAMKLLRPWVAPGGEEQMRRFQREARAIALLNHPNIVSIFDADFDHGCCYIAMEFVEGKTLRTVIRSESQLIDAKTILDMIGQAASALAAAHEAGIVHRDIKPENIMVRPDGFIKVLDFGLAKLREPATGSAVELQTRPGHVAGTIQYLSPEQVAGSLVGPRSDLFSLGVVAYELATGARPFEGPTDGAIFDAILHRDPAPPSSVRPVLGRELDSMILEALEKDPELRFQTAGEMRSSCRRITRDFIARNVDAEPGSRPQAVVSPGTHKQAKVLGEPAARRIRLQWAVMAAAVCALALILFWLTRSVPVPRVMAIVQITHDGLPKEFFVNDGKRVYYAAGSGNAEVKMFQVSAGGGEPAPMPQFAGMIPFDISGDGSLMLLGQLSREPGDSSAIWVGATLGTLPRRLGDLKAGDPRWSPKGDEIVYCDAPNVMLARSDGSEPRILASTNADNLRDPEWSPDGRLIRFTMDRKNLPGIWEVWRNGTHLHPLFPGPDHTPRENGAWTPDGKYFLFSARHTTEDLWAMTQPPHFSFRSGPILFRLTNGPLRADRPQASPDGRKIFFRGRLDRGELVRYDRNSRQWVPYLNGLAAMQLDFSRDRKWITYTRYPDASVWRCAADGSERRQLTTAPLLAMNPRLSPDGTEIVFYGGAPGKPSRLYLVPASGGAVRALTHGEAGPDGDHDGSWSPDGASLVFGPESGEKLPNHSQFAPLAILDLKTGRVSQLPRSEGLWSPRWSPDGQYIAALGFPQPSIWLYKLATHERKQLTTMGASWPSWSQNSQYIYFSNSAAYRVRVSDGRVQALADLDGLKTADGTFGWIGVAPDGSLISTRDASSTEIYRLDWETP